MFLPMGSLNAKSSVLFKSKNTYLNHVVRLSLCQLITSTGDPELRPSDYKVSPRLLHSLPVPHSRIGVRDSSPFKSYCIEYGTCSSTFLSAMFTYIQQILTKN